MVQATLCASLVTQDTKTTSPELCSYGFKQILARSTTCAFADVTFALIVLEVELITGNREKGCLPLVLAFASNITFCKAVLKVILLLNGEPSFGVRLMCYSCDTSLQVFKSNLSPAMNLFQAKIQQLPVATTSLT